MDRELIRDYLSRSMFSADQTLALSNLFADLTSIFATKGDLLDVKADLIGAMADLKAELRSEMADLKTGLRTEMADLKTEVKSEMADLKTEVKSDIAGLRTEVMSDIAGLKTELAAMEARITWRLVGAMGLVVVLLTLFDRFID